MQKASGKKQLRSFGLLVGGVFAVFGLWPVVFHHTSPRIIPLAIAFLLAVPALVAPRILSVPYRAWMALGEVLAWVNTRIILGLVFYLIVTPLGVLRRLAGKGSMKLGFDPGAPSYRVPRTARPASHQEHQF